MTRAEILEVALVPRADEGARGSCRLAGVDPAEYLADVLPKLTRRIRLLDLPSLLPSRWAAARAAAPSAT